MRSMCVPFVILAAATLTACSGGNASEMGDEHVVLRDLVETDVAGPTPEHLRIQGELVPTPSDQLSRYYMLRQRHTLNGTSIAILRQERGQRVAYARTEVDCGRRLFHVVGVAATRGRVESDVAHDGPLRSISGLPLRQELATFICEKGGTPLVGA